MKKFFFILIIYFQLIAVVFGDDNNDTRLCFSFSGGSKIFLKALPDKVVIDSAMLWNLFDGASIKIDNMTGINQEIAGKNAAYKCYLLDFDNIPLTSGQLSLVMASKAMDAPLKIWLHRNPSSWSNYIIESINF